MLTGFGSVDFQRYRRVQCLFGHSRGMEIPHRQGRVNFDMYVRNRRANYTAAMHNAWEPNGNRLHHGERQTESEKERRKSAKAVVDALPSCLPRPSSDSPRFTIRCLRAKCSTLSSSTFCLCNLAMLLW
jgi:hypothetical protein